MDSEAELRRLLEVARAEGFEAGWRAAHERVRALLDGEPVAERDVTASVVPAAARAMAERVAMEPRHAAVVARQRPGRKTEWATAERRALLRTLWAAGERSQVEIWRRLAEVSTEVPLPVGKSAFYRFLAREGLRAASGVEAAAVVPDLPAVVPAVAGGMVRGDVIWRVRAQTQAGVDLNIAAAQAGLTAAEWAAVKRPGALA